MNAIEKETNDLAPVIEKRLQNDVDVSMQSAKDALANAVDKALLAQGDAEREQLLAAFPELAADTAGQDAVLAALRSTARGWSARQLDATVSEHVTAMDNLRMTLQGKYARGEGASADAEDTLMTWLNLMNEHVGGGEDILGADGKTKAPKPAGKE
jgi:hypothetical protein